jgi:hypothetical protein
VLNEISTEPWKSMGEWLYRSHFIFFNLALVGGEWLAWRLGRFIPGKELSCTNWMLGWVGPRAGLDAVDSAVSPLVSPCSLVTAANRRRVLDFRCKVRDTASMRSDCCFRLVYWHPLYCLVRERGDHCPLGPCPRRSIMDKRIVGSASFQTWRISLRAGRETWTYVLQ